MEGFMALLTNPCFLAAAQTEGFIGIDFWTALFTLLNLIITVLVLKKFLFKPVKKMIDDRQKEIDDIYADAESKRSQADELRENYEQKLADAKEESAALVRSANAAAQEQREQILRSAKDEADAIRQKADADIALEKKKALNEVKDAISGMAVEIAEKVVAREINAADQTALIEDFIRNMGNDQ